MMDLIELTSEEVFLLYVDLADLIADLETRRKLTGVMKLEAWQELLWYRLYEDEL